MLISVATKYGKVQKICAYKLVLVGSSDTGEQLVIVSVTTFALSRQQ